MSPRRRRSKVSQTRSVLYTTAKVLGDYDAVRKNRVGQRIKNRVLGRTATKVLRWFR